MDKLTRREALKNMFGVAALAMVPPLVLPQESVRRIWQVGTQLHRPTTLDIETFDLTGHTYNPGVPFSPRFNTAIQDAAAQQRQLKESIQKAMYMTNYMNGLLKASVTR